MIDFFTVIMDGPNGGEVHVTLRKSKVDSLQRNGRTVVILLTGHDPITFTVSNLEEAKKLYLQIAAEMDKG